MADVAVVAGGTGALGRAVVERLLPACDTLLVPSRDPEAARRRLPAGAEAVACDLADPASVAAFGEVVGARGRWTVLAGCTGGYAGGRAATVEDAVVATMLEDNLLGPWRLAAAAARVMAASGGGRIALVLSRAASHPAPGQAAYQVAKAAAARLVEVMALELDGRGVRVNGVLPGTMDTAANREAMPDADRSRWTPVEQVAGVVAWLLTDEAAACVTGALVPAGTG